ncbi:PLP-dependent aminotransferase family protein [Amycolatopsis sp. K13G38]|uniref:PLP-dependent aminotransferase family protein n=1 Tax=Amycolatopsis acididurans TaxID=2724524 RepID=A0ABX1JCN3_9PSEU|nr:PLP-dependent aminotransferase family protein [Amycolatopsis acididurans]NKQ57552.1 PLP-dependent aminotransferase family protein [Amycolatopsis acididurans]
MAESWSSAGWDVHLDWSPASGRRGLADALRRAIRDGRLPAGTAVPSTRALAIDLGIARGTVTRVYADLTAEGYLRTTQGAPTRVAADSATRPPARDVAGPRAAPWVPAVRWDFYPGRPDLSSFPRAAWVSATRKVVAETPASSFDYGDERGPAALREALARYLARSRGVVADPERIVVCGGFNHALTALSRALHERGDLALAFEDPSLPQFRDTAARSRLHITGVPVDERGIMVSEIDSPAVVVTPAHQYPLGHTLAPERRRELARWASAGGLVIEDDYDGEFRLDRQPVGCVQALAPERIVYAGTASKTLAPALRIGWLVLPGALVEPVRAALADTGWRAPALSHLTLAELISSGAYDRHVRQRRTAYRNRRDRLLAALPDGFTPTGISAGLHLLLQVHGDEQEYLAAARKNSVAVDSLGRHWISDSDHPQGIVVGYGSPAEHAFGPALEALVRSLAGKS